MNALMLGLLFIHDNDTSSVSFSVPWMLQTSMRNIKLHSIRLFVNYETIDGGLALPINVWQVLSVKFIELSKPNKIHFTKKDLVFNCVPIGMKVVWVVNKLQFIKDWFEG